MFVRPEKRRSVPETQGRGQAAIATLCGLTDDAAGSVLSGVFSYSQL
jgi:hypothetical protein